MIIQLKLGGRRAGKNYALAVDVKRLIDRGGVVCTTDGERIVEVNLNGERREMTVFKGSTTLELNAATMIVAIQEYLDKRALPAYRPVVKSVTSVSGPTPSFKVELGEPEPNEPS